MRRLFGSRMASGAGVAALVLAVAGTGYAVAGSGTKKINACVSRHTHILYVGKCKHHDRKLSWNQIGPQGPAGPGAKKLVFDATGSASPSETSLGSMGPYTLTASCTQPAAGTTTTNVYVSGPAGRIDGWQFTGSTSSPTASDGSQVFAAINHVDMFGGVRSSSKIPADASSQTLWLPSSGTAVETELTINTIGGTGSGANECHASVVVIPVS
jgi:hypothetical protein